MNSLETTHVEVDPSPDISLVLVFVTKTIEQYFPRSDVFRDIKVPEVSPSFRTYDIKRYDIKLGTRSHST